MATNDGEVGRGNGSNNGAVIHAVVNNNHSDEWRHAMDSFGLNSPGLRFSKVVVWCDSGIVTHRQPEIEAHHEQLQKSYTTTFGSSTLELQSNHSWLTQRSAYLECIAKVLSIDAATGQEVYLSIAPGNLGIRECFIVLASLKGVRIFDRFDRNHPPNPGNLDDCYEIPQNQVECVLKNQFPILFNKYEAAKIVGANISEFCVDLEDNLRLLMDPGAPLNYATRFQTVRTDLQNITEQLERMEVQVMANVVLDRGATVLPLKKSGRVKKPISLWKKILKKEAESGVFIADPFDRFADLVGVRVVVSSDSDLKTVVDWIRDKGPFCDPETTNRPRPEDKQGQLGYKAWHIDVSFPAPAIALLPALNGLDGLKCEIQVKTALSNTWGELSHLLLYKEQRRRPLPDAERAKLERALKNAANVLGGVDGNLDEICKEFDPRV